MALLLRALAGTAVRKVAGRIERLLFATCAVLLAWMAYRAAAREQLGWTPDDLRVTADDARRHLSASPPAPPRVTPYAELARRGQTPVDPTHYKWAISTGGITVQRPKRPTPPVYCVEELLASGGHGVFPEIAETASAGSRSLRGHRWVVVTGAIQHLRQADAFRAAFERSRPRDPVRDYPKYVSFRIERAEIDSQSVSSELEWTALDVSAMSEFQYRWPAAAPELVDERYFPPVAGDLSLVFPLGPRQDRPWGQEVGHPKVPMRPAGEAGRPAGAGTGAARPDGGLGRRGSQPVLPQGGNRGRTGSPSYGGTNGQAGSLPYGGNAAEEAGEPECLLLRFFDYEVEPGKSYCYRVKLLLANPNYRVQGKFLDNEQTAVVELLESPWSEPSPAATVPRDTGVLVAAIDTKKKAMLLLTHLQMRTGEFTAEEFHAVRGQWLNFRGRPLKPCGPMQVQTPPPIPILARMGRVEVGKIDYLLDALVLDVLGGGPLPGKKGLSEPASVLLLDGDGNLVVRNELDDLADRRFYQPSEKPAGQSPPLAGLPPIRRGDLSGR